MGIRGNTREQVCRIIAGVTLAILCVLPHHAGAAPNVALKAVTLQLKWSHQFQFAGYYAAKAQGYYNDEGLDVSFAEREPGMTVVEEVLMDRADFGVGNSDLLLNYFDNDPIVVLGAIFQHSPNILLSKAGTGINSPRSLRGKRVMMLGTTSASLWAMFASQNVTRDELELQQLSWNTDDLINDKTDAMAAYLTDQPYALTKMGIPVTIMRPLSYGIDFYGDCLFTSSELAKNSPELVERFARASFKGWTYAMAHSEEIIELIRLRYNSKRRLDELRYEAEAMQELILPKLVEIGSMSRSRWERIAVTYYDLGMVPKTRSLDDFLYVHSGRRKLESLARWTPYLMIFGSVVIMAAVLLLLFNRRLKRGIERRTRELNRNRESLRQVIDLVPNMIYAKNREGRFLLLNRTMAESLGSTIEALTGALHAVVHPDKDQVRAMQADDRIVLVSNFPKVNMEEPYLFADGTTHWLQTTRLPYTPADSDEPAVLTLSVDITSRRKADADLKSSEERFRATFNQTYQFSGVLNLKGMLTQVNDTVLKTFNVDESEVLGQPYWKTPWWNQDRATHAWLKDAIQRAARGETIRKEATHTMPSGSAMIVDFTLKPARNDENEIIFLIAEGRDITTLKDSEEELRHLNEELENRVVERTRNLEEAKQELEQSLEQLRKTQEELVLAEKLAALGGLVAGVAHEINTPLGIGVTASSFLEERIKELSDKFDQGDLKRSDLEKFIRTGAESSASILTNLGRAAGLIKSFKQVAADQSSEQPRTFNLHSYVDEVLLSLRPKYKRTDHVIENRCPDIELFSYPGAFMQIITNLLVNALTHAYPDGQTGHMIIGGQIADGSLKFSFSDDGVGIAPEFMDKVFEPFYTTKRGEGGTGLGLHIVFNTVTQSLGGTIHCESSPGAGTRYTITMPLKQDQDKEA